MKTWMISVMLSASALAAWFAPGCVMPTPVSTDAAIAHYVNSQALDDAQALVELSKAIEADPTLSMAHVAMGDIHRKRGNYELARTSYETACNTNPYNFRPHYNLGVVYQLLADQAKTPQLYETDLRKACDIYIRAIMIEPTDFDSNLNIGACYFQLGKYDQALKYCKDAIKINPKRAEAYSNLGTIYDTQNNLYEAIAAYKASLEIDTHQPKLLMNLGDTYMRQDRLDFAILAFKQAAKEDPKSSEPWAQIGSCYYRMGNTKLALENYTKALELNKKNPDAYRGIGVVYMTQFVADQSKTDLRDKALAAWNSSLEIKADQDDLRKLVQKYTPRHDAPKL